MGTPLTPKVPTQVERATSESDGQGGFLNNYAAGVDLYCSIKSIGAHGVNRLQAPGQKMYLVYRDVDDIAPGDRITVYLGRTTRVLNVVSVVYDETALLVEAQLQ